MRYDLSKDDFTTLFEDRDGANDDNGFPFLWSNFDYGVNHGVEEICEVGQETCWRETEEEVSALSDGEKTRLKKSSKEFEKLMEDTRKAEEADQTFPEISVVCNGTYNMVKYDCIVGGWP